MKKLFLKFLVLAGLPIFSLCAADDVEIHSIAVRDGIYMLTGRGGNIGVSLGSDGVFLIDDQFAPLTPEIRETTTRLGGGEIRFVLNTHMHGDHTGGNENLGKAGVLIVAHENVRKRMSAGEFLARLREQGTNEPGAALPVVTFSGRISFHINDMILRGEHFPKAHTDGDTVVWFDGRNVVHAGDVFFSSGFPFIDVSNGGSLKGLLAAVNAILAEADEKTKIIPGHGPLSDKAGLEAYRDMLVAVRDRVARLKNAGKSIEQVVAANPLEDLRPRWETSFMTADKLIRAVYAEL